MEAKYKYGIAVAIVVVVVVIVFLLLRKKATGNKYASAAALKAGTSGSDGAWTESGNDGFDDLFTLGITGTFWGNIYNADAYGQAWFKGMNIKLSKANVSKYGSEVAAYASSSFKKPHWEISKGSFLTSTASA